MNFKRDLRITYVLAIIIFIGLVSWNIYFEDEFDPFREPYSSSAFTDRQVTSIQVNNENQEEDTATYGVSAVHPLAAEVGMDIIEAGGNAIDAAVAVSFMLNVVEPYGSGIGGGGLMLYHDPEVGALSYDYREVAAASGAMPERGVAVPGLVKGMELIHENHGELDWETLLEPAITRAEEGFQVGEVFNRQTGNSTRYLDLDPEDYQLFYPNGQTLPVNATLVQAELAETLKLIRDNKAAGFYSGVTGSALKEELNFTDEDFSSYEVSLSQPVVTTIGDQTVYGGPSPSSGTVVLQALKLSEKIEMQAILPEANFPVDMKMGDLTNYPEYYHIYLHLINEITKVTYNDRLGTLGDPNFDRIDHNLLVSNAYIDDLLAEISYDKISDIDASSLFDTPAEEADSRHTTHFVIIDKAGRMVSATHSLGEFYGSGRFVNGFFLNNQLNNFSENELSINRYEPGKRPRTFVSPLIVEKEGMPVLGLGSPGGKRIPAMLFQTIMQYEHRLTEEGEPISLQAAIRLPRYYNEDDVIYTEETYSEETRAFLQEMGYSVIGLDTSLFYGGIQGLGVVLDENGEPAGLYGGGDPRRNGAWQLHGE